jgi:hypothetical protein
MGERELVTIAAVAFGWLLAQITDVIRWMYASRKLRQGLLYELKDIDAQLERILHIHARQIQIYALRGVEPCAALPAPNMFFHQYFRDAFPYLNREQRLSYQLVHSSIDALNAKNERLGQWIEDVNPSRKAQEGTSDASAILEQWGEEVKALYRMAATTRWHIRYHLRNPSVPNMDVMGPMHEQYLKDQERINETIIDIMQRAKNLNREDFDKTYDPRAFQQDSERGV